MKISLDSVDRAILEGLQDDGRRSYRQIARDVGVSEGTVRTRVRRLEDAGVLRVIAFVDPSRLGNSVLALVFVRVSTAQHGAVVKALAELPEATYVSSLVGRADVYIQIICRDNEALWKLVSEIRSLSGVLETETMLEMAVHKFTYRDSAAAAASRQQDA
ncbi:MAG: Lrp/AsnC family transcriptional regulator, regulator for asnA, asnC and gidA [Gaiellales bacterium]|nr:Lrp/AsnC family transcriptional regulator, regulator for asnA, asnC and gidA [Gaiellales bacterium]